MLLPLGESGPLYRRVYEALRQRILGGELPAGARLPGTRTLARDLGVSRIVVLAAFEQLAAEGFIEATVGSGSRVALWSDGPSARRDAGLRARHSRADDGPVSDYAKRAREQGVHAYSALPYYQRPPKTAALILGYTTLGVAEIERGVARLAAAYRSTRP